MSVSFFLRTSLAVVAATMVVGHTAAADVARQEEWNELKNEGKVNSCVEPAGMTVRMAPCSGKRAQLWGWDMNTGLIRSSAGSCLTSHVGKSLLLDGCDAGNPDQRWVYYAKYAVFEIENQPRVLTAHQDSSAVTAEPWQRGSAYQQWGEW